MTIPEKLKIGAKVYGVEITNKLDLGNVNYSGEISYTDLVIRICPNAQAKMEADFLHEMIHGMLDHLGYTEHDEKKVKCPFAVPTCKCYDCACNASYDECNHGYCITCFECLNESKAVHNIYLCTGYERMVANGNENSE